jgi:hypothetical protein
MVSKVGEEDQGPYTRPCCSYIYVDGGYLIVLRLMISGNLGGGGGEELSVLTRAAVPQG